MGINAFFQPKCPEKSKLLREEGNKLFQKKAFHEALEKFNRSALLAPYNDSTELSSALKNEPLMAYALANRCVQNFKFPL